MDNNLSTILAQVSSDTQTEPSPKSNDRPDVLYSKKCKAMRQKMRQIIDNGRFFIAYRRREDKFRGHPMGCAVAFLLDGRLYAGTSVCMMAEPPPTKRFRNAAIKWMADVLAVDECQLAEQARLWRPATTGTDLWSREIGLWKALQNARPVDMEAAKAVANVATSHYQAMKAEQAAGRVKKFKMANVMFNVANDAALPAPFSNCDLDGNMSGWLHATLPSGKRCVPYRVTGTIVSVICAAANFQAKKDVTEAAKAIAKVAEVVKPAKVGV